VTAATAARARDVRGVATRRGSPRRASKPPRVFLFLFLFFFFFFFSRRPNNVTSNITSTHRALSCLSPALSVLVDDPMWDAAQFDVLGATRATFGAVAPGARETLRFAVVPRSSGVFSAGPSLVTYRPAGSGSAEISGTSNALPRIPILSQLEEHLALALKVGAVVSLGFCKTAEDWSRGAAVFGGVAALLFLNQCLLTGRRAVRANRRRKAIAELTKDE
jgi:hypothetical protein